MIDLRDVTFNIPVKIDQPNRGRNLEIVIRYLKRYFDTNIIVCEMDSDQKARPFIAADCKYVFMKTNSPFIHRTMQLNYMASISETPIIVNYDVDVLLPPENYQIAAGLIRRKEAEMVYPFAGNFYNTEDHMVGRISDTLDVMFIDPSHCQNLAPNFKSVGGAIFWDKQKFLDIGMENENFVSWGHEDQERFERANILGTKIARIAGDLFHLRHLSSLNSSNAAHSYYKNNESEWLKVKQMNKPTLLKYIESWPWLKDKYKINRSV
jgi:predicted glycosyltransferase involved in capsule biosynthesis